MLNYQIGHLHGAPVTIEELGNLYRPLTDVIQGPDASKIPAAKAQLALLQNAFREPTRLTSFEGRLLVLHNLILEAVTNRGKYVIGQRVLTPAEARAEVWSNGPLSRPLVTLGVRFAQTLIESSGLQRRFP